MNGFFSRLHRKGNEDGFILPLTMVIIFLICAFLLHEIKMYEAEKRFLQTREDLFVTDQMMQMAVVDLKVRLHHSNFKGGTFLYKKGTVRYSIKNTTGSNMLCITLRAKANSGGLHVSRMYYDKMKQKIVRWEEGL